MPYYPKLKFSRELNTQQKKSVASNLISLRSQLSSDVPQKDLDDHLLLCTWNIRDLGKNGSKHGKRNLEDLLYIAEIISAFDLVAVQEVNDLEDWETVMAVLGDEWDYIATDVSEFADGGNGERMTFVFDTRKVWFRNVAGEIVLSRTNLISENVEVPDEDKNWMKQKRQFARTPFLVSFQAGWFHFDLCTVHIYFGAESGKKLQRRIKEIDAISEEIADRAKLSVKDDKTTILLGDFNIVHPDHNSMKALKKHKFKIPSNLQKPANVKGDKYYDQIAIYAPNNKVINFIQSTSSSIPNGGVFELFKTVMKESDYTNYKTRMKKTTKGKKLRLNKDFKKYFSEWRTYHLSDHKPMWARIPINYSEEYLKNL